MFLKTFLDVTPPFISSWELFSSMGTITEKAQALVEPTLAILNRDHQFTDAIICIQTLSKHF